VINLKTNHRAWRGGERLDSSLVFQIDKAFSLEIEGRRQSTVRAKRWIVAVGLPQSLTWRSGNCAVHSAPLQRSLAMAFKCVVVTPEQQMFDETITQAIVPAHDGKIGILTDRAPLLVKLGAGELRLDLQGGQSRRFTIKGGIAQMKDNQLTILTSEASAEAAAR
jgi:hypothetical protein